MRLSQADFVCSVDRSLLQASGVWLPKDLTALSVAAN